MHPCVASCGGNVCLCMGCLVDNDAIKGAQWVPGLASKLGCTLALSLRLLRILQQISITDLYIHS